MEIENWVTCTICDQTFTPGEIDVCRCHACHDAYVKHETEMTLALEEMTDLVARYQAGAPVQRLSSVEKLVARARVLLRGP